MADRPETLVRLIGAVRRRWLTVAWLRAVSRAGAASALLTAVSLLAYFLVQPDKLALVALAASVLVGISVCFLVAAWPLRRPPDTRRLARFIEERVPELDDSLVTAVELRTAGEPGRGSALLDSFLHDADRRAVDVDVERVIPRARVRHAWLVAGGSLAALFMVLVFSRTPARRAYEAASVHALPWRVAIEVTPGNARVRAGQPITISVRLSGAGTVLSPTLRLESEEGRELQMRRDGGDDRFSLTIDDVRRSFDYRVEAGTLSSPTFTVTALRPPRVSRIDLRYEYPAGLGLPARTEEDSGDIYAPPGTRVRLRVRADKPIVQGELKMAGAGDLQLAAVAPDVLEGELRVAGDGSYRVSLADSDGLESEGETEYFIRTLDDRPPEVRIVKPAADRQVTRLEEVAIDAQAADDYGIERFELVYSVRGRAEKVLPFTDRVSGTSVSGSRTIYLEEMDVQPGDFITYYARARDVAKGRRSTEGRSDIFFLEVKPYDEQFVSAESQGMRAGANSRSLEELAAAQKNIIIATWKLDRRSVSGRSRQDILSVAGAQAALRERAAGMVRQLSRFGGDRRGSLSPSTPTDQDPMSLAVQAMSSAEEALGTLKTSTAIPHEMEALNQLLRAQAEVRRRQVARQSNGGGGGGSNRPTQDLSALFDRELQRQQETNYETPTSAAANENTPDDSTQPLDKIRELARRQNEMSREQQELARQQTTIGADELKRRLERLTREQSELRREAEELARELSQQQSAEQQSQQGMEGQQGQQGQPRQQGKQGQQGQQGQGQQGQGQRGQQAQGPGGQGSQAGGAALREASEDMQGATSDLRRQDPGQASERSGRALEKLRALERQLQSRQPDNRRRALGDLQLEARQLADSQRQMAGELQRNGQSPTAETLRRLAGEKERLAERVQRFEQSVKDLEGTARSDEERGTIGEVTAELAEQQIERRLRESSDTMRQEARAAAGSGEPRPPGKNGVGEKNAPGARDKAARAADRRLQDEQELTRAFERVAERMGAAGGERDGETRKLSEQLARARELRERLSGIEEQMRQGRPAGQENGSPSGPDGSAASDASRLKEDFARQLGRARDLLESPAGQGAIEGGRGSTPEKWEPSVSAPGTEAFKQDFADWGVLRRDITLALERLEASLSSRLQEKETRDRLSAGADDRAPDAYRALIDQYFRSLASTSKP